VADWQNIQLCLKVTVCWDMVLVVCWLGRIASEDGAASVGRDAGSNWM